MTTRSMAQVHYQTSYAGVTFSDGVDVMMPFLSPAQFLKRAPYGGTARFTCSIIRSWEAPGQKRITVNADVGNQMAESVEFNNTGLFIVDVY